MTDSVSSARVFGAILLRDLTVARREIVSLLVRTALQPLLFVTIFGFLLPRMGMVRPGYTSVILPGVPAMQWAVLVNPLVYVSEGLRGTLTPAIPHMPIVVSAAAMVVVAAIFLRLGLRSFGKKAIG